MTKKESQDFITQINSLISEFKKDISQTFTELEKREEKIDNQIKNSPVNLELNILSSVQSSINKAIQEVLVSYNSPLLALVRSVIEDHSRELKEIISKSFKEVIQVEDFKKSIISAFSHKVSRSIISNSQGLFDKVSNELKQDPVFKSRMVLATSNVVEECLREKKLEQSPPKGSSETKWKNPHD